MAYVAAMVIGTLGSNAAVKKLSGMLKGRSKCGGGMACGSVGGGKLKRDREGASKKTDGEETISTTVSRRSTGIVYD